MFLQYFNAASSLKKGSAGKYRHSSSVFHFCKKWKKPSKEETITYEQHNSTQSLKCLSDDIKRNRQIITSQVLTDSKK